MAKKKLSKRKIEYMKKLRVKFQMSYSLISNEMGLSKQTIKNYFKPRRNKHNDNRLKE